jgi:hypothetical protein
MNSKETIIMAVIILAIIALIVTILVLILKKPANSSSTPSTAPPPTYFPNKITNSNTGTTSGSTPATSGSTPATSGSTPATSGSTPATSGSPVTLNAPGSSLIELYQLQSGYNKGVPAANVLMSSQFPNPISSTFQGFYLENLSNQNITDVNLTFYLTTDANITIDFVSSAGTPPASGSSNSVQCSSGTSTYDITCFIPPGGGFVITSVNSISGTVEINSLTFASNPILAPVDSVLTVGAYTSLIQFYLLQSGFQKGAKFSQNGMSFSPSFLGFYVQNNSKYPLTNVNFTLNTTDQNPIYLNTVNTPTSEPAGSMWQQYNAKTQNPTGGYTNTYDYPCNIPPGGAFLLNSNKETSSGTIIFNSVSFATK